MANPAPVVPTTVVHDENTYSESRPYKPVLVYPREYVQQVTRTRAIKKVDLDDSDPDLISVDSTLVRIPVSVFNRNGLYVSDIKKDEVRVFEDGTEQEIAYFGVSEKPFTVALLLDTSPSTEYKIEEIRRAAKEFVNELKPEDKVLVMEFDNNPQVLAEATTDRRAIYHAIDQADFGFGTSLYDAVDFVLNKRLNEIEGRKAVVLFTDGVDTVSKRTYDDTLRVAEESDAIIFPIYYNTIGTTGNANGSILNRPLPPFGGMGRTGDTPEEAALGKKYLEDLAAYTGGRVFEPERSYSGLEQVFRNLAQELRVQYDLAYYPSNPGKPGERKKIKVRIYRPNLIVRARDSYFVDANQ